MKKTIGVAFVCPEALNMVDNEYLTHTIASDVV